MAVREIREIRVDVTLYSVLSWFEQKLDGEVIEIARLNLELPRVDIRLENRLSTASKIGGSLVKLAS